MSSGEKRKEQMLYPLLKRGEFKAWKVFWRGLAPIRLRQIVQICKRSAQCSVRTFWRRSTREKKKGLYFDPSLTFPKRSKEVLDFNVGPLCGGFRAFWNVLDEFVSGVWPPPGSEEILHENKRLEAVSHDWKKCVSLSFVVLDLLSVSGLLNYRCRLIDCVDWVVWVA